MFLLLLFPLMAVVAVEVDATVVIVAVAIDVPGCACLLFMYIKGSLCCLSWESGQQMELFFIIFTIGNQYFVNTHPVNIILHNDAESILMNCI